AAYQDPSIFGTWFYWRADGGVARSKIDEFNLSMSNDANLQSPELFRRTPVWATGVGVQLGLNLPLHLHVSAYYRVQSLIFEKTCISDSCAQPGSFPPMPPVMQGTYSIADFTPGPDGTESYFHFDFGYDSTVNTWGIKTGTAMGGWYEYGDKALGSTF